MNLQQLQDGAQPIAAHLEESLEDHADFDLDNEEYDEEGNLIDDAFDPMEVGGRDPLFIADHADAEEPAPVPEVVTNAPKEWKLTPEYDSQELDGESRVAVESSLLICSSYGIHRELWSERTAEYRSYGGTESRSLCREYSEDEDPSRLLELRGDS